MSLFNATKELYGGKDSLPAEGLDTVIEREQEYAELQDVLDGVVAGGEEVAVVVGPVGSGKTTLVHRSLDAASTHDDFVPAVVDCEAAGTQYRACIHAVNELRSGSDTLAETGHSFESVKEELRREANRVSETGVLIFDGIDTLEKLDALGALAHQSGIGVICIADQTESPSLPDTWPRHTVIRFHEYTFAELRDLLDEWADLLLPDRTLSGAVVPLCAAYGVEANGNARIAIQLLREAAQAAEEERTDRVTGLHVQQAKEKADRKALAAQLEEVDEHEHMLLYTILSLDSSDELPARTATVYDEYVTLTADADFDPLSKRRVQDRLRTLAQTDFLAYTEYNEGRTNGIYWEYELACEESDLRSLLNSGDNAVDLSPSGLFR